MATFNGNAQFLRQALRPCPVNFAENAQFNRITGVSTHDVYRVEGEGEQLIVKQFFNESFTQLNRAAVFNTQKKLAKLKLAPHPIWFDSVKGLWVEHYVEPLPSPRGEADKLNVLGKTLAVIHQVDILDDDTPHLNLPAQWDRYLGHIDQANVANWRDAIAQGKQDVAEFFDWQSSVLCHNDLAFSHIVNACMPVVVDWEYVARGNRYFDLAAAINVNRIPRHQVEELCEVYAEHSGICCKDVQLGVQQMKHIVRITNDLWYEAKSALPL